MLDATGTEVMILARAGILVPHTALRAARLRASSKGAVDLSRIRAAPDARSGPLAFEGQRAFVFQC